MTVRGGERLKAQIKKSRAKAQELNGSVVRVSEPDIPERSAMASHPTVKAAVREVVAEGVRTLPVPELLQRAADTAKDATKREYQKAGASQELIDSIKTNVTDPDA